MIVITEKQKCCGCEACVIICPKHCITMIEDSEGFLYPSVDLDACIDCGLCEEVCPFLNPGERNDDPVVYAAINKDSSVRMSSSSGGVFSALAELVINDGGVVFGARWDSEWGVKHDYTETLEGVAAFRGSKYLQSRTGDCYAQAQSFLDAGSQVLFSGTPCQIAGLNKFLKKRYPSLLTVDFVCHGVPSPKVFKIFLKQLTQKKLPQGAVVTSIEQKSKRGKFNWRNPGFVVKWKGQTGVGSYSDMTYRNVFGLGFLTDLFLRPSCHTCKAKAGRSGSDITIGDFWGIERVKPEMDDNKGVSLVLVNTDAGCNFYNALEANITSSSVNYANLKAFCPVFMISVRKNKNRRRFFKALITGRKPLSVLVQRYGKLSLKIQIRNRLAKILSDLGVLNKIRMFREKIKGGE